MVPPVVARPPVPLASPPAPMGPARFVVEFGPFVTTGDAERVERQLAEVGVPTARFRQQTGAGVYAVLIERIPPGRGAHALAQTLRGQGFSEATVVREDPPAVRLGEAQPLRGAVEFAERARALGHTVRVAAEPGQAVAYTIRHGSFASRRDAEAKADELGRLGLSQQVIEVR
jgi:hypothetical protein